VIRSELAESARPANFGESPVVALPGSLHLQKYTAERRRVIVIFGQLVAVQQKLRIGIFAEG
jgi:hypothetical protein